MSLSNSITKMLNMEDVNLNFNKNFLEERKIKGKRCIVIKGYLKVDVVDYLLSKDKIFENSYDLYQNILYYLQHREYNHFNEIVTTKYENISKEMKVTLTTLKKYSKYIKNTLEYSYSNGVMERNNNTCKLIKRISFGFKNFRNMKSRIMIITNIFRKEKREYHTLYSIPKYT